MTIETVITHEGTEYLAELGTVERTELGVEDHGIFTLMVYLDYQSGGFQGAGGYALDEYDEVAKTRNPTLYGMQWVNAVMNLVGVRHWENLPGCYVYALVEEKFGRVIGLASKNGERVLIFSEVGK